MTQGAMGHGRRLDAGRDRHEALRFIRLLELRLVRRDVHGNRAQNLRCVIAQRERGHDFAGWKKRSGKLLPLGGDLLDVFHDEIGEFHERLWTRTHEGVRAPPYHSTWPGGSDQNFASSIRSNGDEAGHDWAGAHGRRHGAAPDARRPRMRGLRHAPGGRQESRASRRLRGVFTRRAGRPGRPPADPLAKFAPILEEGDIVVDGGNSYYRDDIRRGAELKRRGIHYVDVGTSGGVAGLERGYCLMIGGEKEVVQHLAPVFATLAPGAGAAAPTPGRGERAGSAEQGYLHCGPHGAGHFVKMVHNGIEYGLMAAYAEGLNILRHADAGLRSRDTDSETTPLRHPEYYRYELDLPEIAELWRRGSVIGSWLLALTARALLDDPGLEGYAGRVSDSGEGRWTLEAAVDEGVPAHAISAALFSRFESRGEAGYADRLLSAMRKQFGGHDEKK